MYSPARTIRKTALRANYGCHYAVYALLVLIHIHAVYKPCLSIKVYLTSVIVAVRVIPCIHMQVISLIGVFRLAVSSDYFILSASNLDTAGEDNCQPVLNVVLVYRDSGDDTCLLYTSTYP